jgi:hypothetical protein
LPVPDQPQCQVCLQHIRWHTVPGCGNSRNGRCTANLSLYLSLVSGSQGWPFKVTSPS